MRLSWEVVTVHTRHAFVIARGGSSEHRVVRITITDDDGATGWGEAAPNRFYGENADTAVAALAQLAPVVERCEPFHLDDLERTLRGAIRGNGSVTAGISAAAHDLVGKRLGVPLYRLWGLDPSRAPLSSFTIAIAADDDDLRRRIAEAAEYPVLKIKLGTDRDRHIMDVVRAAAPKDMARPDDGFANATDPQADLLGSINRIYGVPGRVEKARNYRGTYGFITD